MNRQQILSCFLSLTFATLGLNLLAQDASKDSGRTELKSGASDEDVKKDLASPDGASLQLLPDGGWRIYGQGSATYDFNDSDEIRGATQDATLRAKAVISKLLGERVQTKEMLNHVSTKLKHSNISGDEQQTDVSKSEVQQRVENIVATSDEILRGVVVLESVKKPVGKGGEITVIVGISSKTQKTSEAIKAKQPLPGVGPKPAAKHQTSSAGQENRPETKKNKTDF